MSENDTESLRAERGDPGAPPRDRDEGTLSLGAAIRGPIGREGAPPAEPSSEGGEGGEETREGDER